MFLELSCSCSAGELRPHSQAPVDMFEVRACPLRPITGSPLGPCSSCWVLAQRVVRFAAGVRHVAVDGLLREPGTRGQTVAPCWMAHISLL